MLASFLKSIRGLLILLLLGINMVLVAILIIVSALLVWMIPARGWRQCGMKQLLKLPVIWMHLNKLIISLCAPKQTWDIQGPLELDPNGWYVLIANHRSWLDILILGRAFTGKIPIIKFFMKKELLWGLPVAGLACYVLGYPFLVRHTRSDIRKNPSLKGKDIETTKKACQKFKDFPTTVMNFVEGTRFSTDKRDATRSPYRHLLKPKSGGTALVLEQMSDKLTAIIDVTIMYSEPNPTFWQCVRGDIRRITVHYELLPIEEKLLGDYYEDREFRKRFQPWLNDLWERKDALIDTIKTKTHDQND